MKAKTISFSSSQAPRAIDEFGFVRIYERTRPCDHAGRVIILRPVTRLTRARLAVREKWTFNAQ